MSLRMRKTYSEIKGPKPSQTKPASTYQSAKKIKKYYTCSALYVKNLPTFPLSVAGHKPSSLFALVFVVGTCSYKRREKRRLRNPMIYLIQPFQMLQNLSPTFQIFSQVNLILNQLVLEWTSETICNKFTSACTSGIFKQYQ